MKNALISVFEKDGIDAFAQELVDLGWTIFASGGTAGFLAGHGIPVTDVAELVGGEAILGHRVVTLSRELHAGLISEIGKDDAELEHLGIPRIDLVCVDFYPLQEAIAKPGATTESVIDATDVGGPAMVRSAAKGNRIVICDPADRSAVLQRIKDNGDLSPEERQQLRAKAEFVVAGYTLDSARFHSNGHYDGMPGQAVRELAYGESRYQSPAHLLTTNTNDPLAIPNFEIISGEPRYVGTADLDRALDLLCFLAEAFEINFHQPPFIAIACKHGNPCGVGVDWSDPRKAVRKMLFGNTDAVMGGEVITDFYITDELGDDLFTVPEEFQGDVKRERWGLDLIATPGFSDNARGLLGDRERRCLLVNDALTTPRLPESPWMHRPVRGGWLRQRAPRYVLNVNNVQEWIGTRPDEETLMSLLIAWAVAWRATSNAVALANDQMLIGLGAGQQDRRAACRLAVERALAMKHPVKGSMFASDGFFPFATTDGDEDDKELLEGPDLFSRVGCRGGVVPGDGMRLDEVREFFREARMNVCFVASENRGFSCH